MRGGGGVWSQLVPVDDEATPMVFRIFSFHFDPGFDATGFVGWLHSHLARATDTGHIVVCGRSAHGATDHVREPGFSSLPARRPGLHLASNGDCSASGCFKNPEAWMSHLSRGRGWRA